MGSGVSAGANFGVVESETRFKALESAYESSKDLDNLALFELLSGVYESVTIGPTLQAEEEIVCARKELKAVDVGVSKKLDTNPEEKEAREERSKAFLVACGAFHKGSAKADIVKAKELFEQGVDVDHTDSDG